MIGRVSDAGRRIRHTRAQPHSPLTPPASLPLQGKMKSFDVFDPDYDNEAHFGRTGKKGGARGGALQVGYGKRNPNDVRSRTKKR